MDRNDLLKILIVNSGILFSTAIVLAALWLRARERALRAELSARAGVDPRHADEMARMQRSIDAVALEVERLGEGQRFVTRLLSERDVLQRGIGEGRVVTPH